MSQRISLGVLASHPIQYHAPWFRRLAQKVDLEVFFAHRPSAEEQGTGFGKSFTWDVDLLSGYQHQFLKNRSRWPSTNHFFGCDTPEIRRIIRGQPPSQTGYGGPGRTEDSGRNRFDAFIVCGWNLKCYWQAIRACRRAGIPILVRCDSQIDPSQHSVKRVLKQITHRLMLRQFDGFLGAGQRNREYLVNYGVPGYKIFHLPPCVDNQWFTQRAKDELAHRAARRDSWNATAKTLVVLYVGKLQWMKRPGDILLGIAQLRHCGIKAVAVFVGAGESDESLRSLAKDLDVAGYFEGFKNQTELPCYYSAADVLVLPSERESWGLVVNEAMACGLPAIVSDAVGCAPDLIDEGETGFTFNVGDSEDLAKWLDAFAGLKRNGHDFWPALAFKMRAYSIEQAVNATRNTIEEVITRRRNASFA